MKLTMAISVILALGVGFWLGRATAPTPESELSTLASFQRALDDPDWLTRWYRFSGFLMHLDPDNLPEALEALEPQLPWLVTDELRVFMLAWSRFDAPGAFAQAMSWPGQLSRNTGGAALYAWAFRDPTAALEALDSVENPETREFMEARLIAGWAHGEHRPSAFDYVASLPEGPRRFAYIGTLAWELAKDGPEAVIRWAEGVPDLSKRYKAGVFLKASSTLASSDPAGAARWLAGHLDQDYADGVLKVVARSWAGRDAPAALGWLTSLPAGERRDGTVSNAFSVWHELSPREAEHWLSAETPAAPLDPAVRVVVTGVRRESPRIAMNWALALHDPDMRRRVVVNVGRSWIRRDAPAAEGWLAQADLPADLEQAIRKARPDPGVEPLCAGETDCGE